MAAKQSTKAKSTTGRTAPPAAEMASKTTGGAKGKAATTTGKMSAKGKARAT